MEEDIMANGFHQVEEEDSDEESDAAAAGGDAYYHQMPVDSDEDSGIEVSGAARSNGGDPCRRDAPLVVGNPNPSPPISWSEEGDLSALDLNADEDDDEEEEREREREASIRRAFMDDEARRRAPLTPEAASRVVEAMRGVTIGGGSVPDWASRVPEPSWFDQLGKLRGD